jgi:hypothetical protein
LKISSRLDQSIIGASTERKFLMDKFAEGCARTRFEFNPLSELKDRIVKHVTDAASSRRFQVADGPDFGRIQGTSALVVPPESPTAPGTSPDPGSLAPSGVRLVQFGRRVFGEPGEAGTD